MSRINLWVVVYLFSNILPSFAFTTQKTLQWSEFGQRRTSVSDNSRYTESSPASHSLVVLCSAVADTSSAEKDDVSTIQILMSDTGGGHRASANALRDAFDVLYPGKIECDIVDIYSDYGPFWPFNDYPALYKIMAKYDFLWDWFYHFGATELGLQMNEFFLELFCFDSFKECLSRPSGSTNKRADMVVSVHPLCQDIPLKILADLDTDGKTRDPSKKTTPFMTVVTDLGGAHPTWFNPGVDKCFVPSDVLYQCALDRNVESSHIIKHGLPIRKGFWSSSSTAEEEKNNGGILSRLLFRRGKANKDTESDSHVDEKATAISNEEKLALREELGLDADLPAVLIVGGGDGMGGLVDIAKSMGKKLGSSSDKPLYQMVVVCGSNKEAKSALESEKWDNGVIVKVNGFVYNMDEWMKASDAIVTKAGPGTIAEASICGLPCILFSYLPGQEAGNIPFVEDSGFGSFSADPTVIADTLLEMFSSPEKLERMKSSALDAARPHATLDIAHDLAELLFEHKQKQN